MATNVTSRKDEETRSSLEKIKHHLNRGSGHVLLEGYLLKRSETLRKWNRRWFTLDPSTGKMEYRSERGDVSPRGLITFDAQSTITVSPLNFMKESKFDGCCFYIGTSQKKEFFFCAETPVAARAWVATLRAAALVLKAHKEAVESLSGHGHAKLGDVAAVVAAANATAREAAKDLQSQMKIPTLAATASHHSGDGGMDNVTVMKETLRVKDEEIHQLSRDLKARDLTIKELAERLSQTAQAAESAASSVYTVEKQRKEALSEVDHLRNELLKIRAADEQATAALKTREAALKEAHHWRLELGKVRERGVILEAALVRAEENVRQLKAAHENRLRDQLQAQTAREHSLLHEGTPSEPTVAAPTAEMPEFEAKPVEASVVPASAGSSAEVPITESSLKTCSGEAPLLALKESPLVAAEGVGTGGLLEDGAYTQAVNLSSPAVSEAFMSEELPVTSEVEASRTSCVSANGIDTSGRTEHSIDMKSSPSNVEAQEQQGDVTVSAENQNDTAVVFLEEGACAAYDMNISRSSQQPMDMKMPAINEAVENIGKIVIAEDPSGRGATTSQEASEAYSSTMDEDSSDKQESSLQSAAGAPKDMTKCESATEPSDLASTVQDSAAIGVRSDDLAKVANSTKELMPHSSARSGLENSQAAGRLLWATIDHEHELEEHEARFRLCCC
ncbi:unnamed protein product [Sphagnum troendelagicum]|uniref:PH domain-containing protein n=1 Tax=Sphagnum troendelagicum TaxID=128251 RepID=A0ABP0UKP9_9BRYO